MGIHEEGDKLNNGWQPEVHCSAPPPQKPSDEQHGLLLGHFPMPTPHFLASTPATPKSRPMNTALIESLTTADRNRVMEVSQHHKMKCVRSSNSTWPAFTSPSHSGEIFRTRIATSLHHPRNLLAQEWETHHNLLRNLCTLGDNMPSERKSLTSNVDELTSAGPAHVALMACVVQPITTRFGKRRERNHARGRATSKLAPADAAALKYVVGHD